MAWTLSIDVEQSQVSPSSARLQSHSELPAANTNVDARTSERIRRFKYLMT